MERKGLEISVSFLMFTHRIDQVSYAIGECCAV